MKVSYACVALAIAALPFAATAADPLPLPKSVMTDRSIPAPQREAMALAARRYYAFWDTGDVVSSPGQAPLYAPERKPPTPPLCPSWRLTRVCSSGGPGPS